MMLKIRFFYLPIACVITLSCFNVGYSQESSTKFLYKKQSVKNVVSYSLTGSDTVKIPKPKLTQPKTYERKILSSKGNYNFVLNKKEKKCTLFSEDGQTLGTFPLKGKNRLDITMPDGMVYNWSYAESSRGWKYSVNSKEVFVCSFIKVDGKKYLQYEIKDPEAKDLSTAMIISHIYGVDLIQTKANQPIYYGIAIGLGLLGAATSSSPAPSVQ